MNKSENIDQLALALSNLQGELLDAHKSSQGYGYNYADLSSVLNIIRPLLKKHGLSIAQPVGGDEGKVTLTTILMHSSGQFVSSSINVSVDLTNKKMNSLQAAGSTITYLRRYCISSILGLASTDDDGKAGGEHMDDHIKELRTLVAAYILEPGPRQEITMKAMSHYNVNLIEELSLPQLQAIITRVNKG